MSKQLLHRPADAPPGGARRGVDAQLLDAASAAEPGPSTWIGEFRWLLGHAAISPVAAPEPDAPLTLAALAGQYAACFPRVSADADWLAGRSMAVVARRLAPLLAPGAEVALDLSTVTGIAPAQSPRPEHMRLVASGLEASLPAALARYGIAPGRLTLSAGADHPGIGDLLRLRHCAALGRPGIAIRLPDALMLALRGAETGEPAAWRGDPLPLWQGLTGIGHREPGVHLLLQQTTRPACTLAAGERSDAVLPLGLFEVRADSAWLAVELRLDALPGEAPAAAFVGLRRLLRATLRLADNLVEQADWPSPELGQDALVNRRLALHVTGLGDLVDRWGLDPEEFGTVRLALRWIGLLRRLLLRESNALARERGPFPGLQLQELQASLSRSFGAERARRVLRQAGLRHRHLLVLSPYAVFPRGRPRRPLPAYLHLLPVTRFADTIAMHGDGIIRALPPQTFRRLLRLAWAIGHNRP